MVVGKNDKNQVLRIYQTWFKCTNHYQLFFKLKPRKEVGLFDKNTEYPYLGVNLKVK